MLQRLKKQTKGLKIQAKIFITPFGSSGTDIAQAKMIFNLLGKLNNSEEYIKFTGLKEKQKDLIADVAWKAKLFPCMDEEKNVWVFKVETDFKPFFETKEEVKQEYDALQEIVAPHGNFTRIHRRSHNTQGEWMGKVEDSVLLGAIRSPRRGLAEEEWVKVDTKAFTRWKPKSQWRELPERSELDSVSLVKQERDTYILKGTKGDSPTTETYNSADLSPLEIPITNSKVVRVVSSPFTQFLLVRRPGRAEEGDFDLQGKATDVTTASWADLIPPSTAKYSFGGEEFPLRAWAFKVECGDKILWGESWSSEEPILKKHTVNKDFFKSNGIRTSLQATRNKAPPAPTTQGPGPLPPGSFPLLEWKSRQTNH